METKSRISLSWPHTANLCDQLDRINKKQNFRINKTQGHESLGNFAGCSKTSLSAKQMLVN